MKNIRLRILELLDQHGKTFEKCKGCAICTEIKQLRKQLERDPADKFKHILAKGPDMHVSEIKLMLENQVPQRKIMKAVGMHNQNFWDMLRDLGLLKRSRSEDMAKLSFEMYQDYKAQGLPDKEVAAKVGMNPQYLSQLKKQWGVRPPLSVVNDEKPQQCNCTKEDKSAEYERLIKALRDDLNSYHNQLEEKDELIRNLQNVVEKYEQVNAACEDVENETDELQQEVSRLREERNQYQEEAGKHLEQSIQKDYTLENWKNRYKILMEQNAHMEKENRAFREALKLCL
jgi:hypothetical protein